MFGLPRQALRRASPLLKSARPCPAPRRALHGVPGLTHYDRFAEAGVPGLLSNTGFKISWIDYQRGLVDKLNELVAGTDYETKHPLSIAVMTQRQPDLAATFNYASQAYNNHFFFETLSPQGRTSMPEALLTELPKSFSTVNVFRDEFLATAEAMFGAGWVWLVLDRHKVLRILCTYNAGTPHGPPHRRQSTDMNTKQTLGSAAELTQGVRDATQAGAVNQWAIPLMNMPVWEHVWLHDFGINGKRRYLEACWNAIDWSVVTSRMVGNASR